MDESDVQDYVERSRRLISSSPQMDEENTKVKIIQPLIDILGWSVYSSEVELEYQIQIGRGNTRADYALLLEETPVIFIEAKGCDKSLSDSDRRQLTSYMRQKGVDWGLLTNGRQFEVLRRREDRSRPDEVTLADFPLEELPAHRRVLNLLSREMISSGEAGKVAQQIRVRQEAVQRLRGQKDTFASEVTEVIISEIDELLLQEVQSASKEFVDRLIEELEEEPDTVDAVTERQGLLANGAQTQSPANSANKSDDTDPDPIYSAVVAQGDDQRRFEDTNQSDVMRDVTNYLVTEHDLIDAIGPLPYVPGKKNAILNDEPSHPSGEDMRLYREVANGLFLFVALSKESKKRYLRRFAESCGLDITFSGEW